MIFHYQKHTVLNYFIALNKLMELARSLTSFTIQGSEKSWRTILILNILQHAKTVVPAYSVLSNFFEFMVEDSMYCTAARYTVSAPAACAPPHSA